MCGDTRCLHGTTHLFPPRRSSDLSGQALRMAFSDVAFATMSHLGVLTEAAVGLPERESLGNDIYGAFGRDFATADRRRIMVAAISTRQWQALMIDRKSTRLNSSH